MIYNDKFVKKPEQPYRPVPSNNPSQPTDLTRDLENLARQQYERNRQNRVFQHSQKYGRGNIDLTNRPQYKYPDGRTATVESMSFGNDEGEILVPTIARDAKGNPTKLSDDEAIQRYYDTGEYLGKFDTIDEADKYADWLHRQQENYYLPQRSMIPVEDIGDEVDSYDDGTLPAYMSDLWYLGDNELPRGHERNIAGTATVSRGQPLGRERPIGSDGFGALNSAMSRTNSIPDRVDMYQNYVDQNGYNFTAADLARASDLNMASPYRRVIMDRLPFEEKRDYVLDNWPMDLTWDYRDQNGFNPTPEQLDELIENNWNDMEAEDLQDLARQMYRARSRKF